MLRRRSSRRLNHRKSASSIHSRYEPIDAETARQHAHAAAAHAFARAQERSSTEIGPQSSRRRSTSGASHQDPSQSSPQDDASASGKSGLKRQHSVRFAGANAIPRRKSIGVRANQSKISAVQDTATLRSTALMTDTPAPSVYRPMSRSSSMDKIPISCTAPGGHVRAQTLDDIQAREDDTASTPSSYRRIRRSKSLFNPGKAPHLFYTNGTPEHGENRLGSAFSASRNSQSYPYDTPLRAPKSMSLLRFGRDPIIPERREQNDEAVQMARDRFFQQATEQRLREQPSFISKTKSQRHVKPFQTSVRTSSSGHEGPIKSSNQNPFNLRVKARTASENLRTKLRKLFSRKRDGPIVIPDQQVEASETYVRQYSGQNHGNFNDVPRPNEATISRVASRPPSLRVSLPNQRLRSQTGSLRSITSESSEAGEDKSRVTSWNSTAVDTLTSQGARAHGERERQRLSIINETGTHIPSASFKRPRLSSQTSPYPILHGRDYDMNQRSIVKPTPVDSARVYSVLMKHVKETGSDPILERPRKGSVEKLDTSSPCIPTRTSSVNSTPSNRTPLTIRAVPRDGSVRDRSHNLRQREMYEQRGQHQWVNANSLYAARAENMFGVTGPHVHQWAAADSLREARMRDQDDVFSPCENIHDETVASEVHRQAHNQSCSSFPLSHQLSTKSSYYSAPSHIYPTAKKDIPSNRSSTSDSRRLTESRSTFFGGAAYTNAKLMSPYRRLLAEREKHDDKGDDAAPFRRFRLPAEEGRYGSEGKACSESNYSRTTSGQTPIAAPHALSPLISDSVPEMSFPVSHSGEAVIIDTATYQPARPSPARRITSSASSIDWRKWMSSEVAKLESAREDRPWIAATRVKALSTKPKIYSSRHVRENAQISEDDNDSQVRRARFMEKKRIPSSSKPMMTSFLGDDQVQTVPKPILKIRGTPFLAKNTNPGPAPKQGLPLPPSVPERLPLVTMQSTSSLRSVSTASKAPGGSSFKMNVASVSGQNVLHRRNASSTTLRSVQSFEAPAKLIKQKQHTDDHAISAHISGRIENYSLNSDSRMRNRENFTPERDFLEDIYSSNGAGLMGPRTVEPQSTGSKRMVEEFLNSRRKRIDGGNEEDGRAFV